ncbi:ComF family protein [Neobacillus niacini]|uniref:ComF family protein n=1 Tax=Neobacillus niacini TaxID=86668 RepID=UPI0021CAF70D|nr:ComF family protein [Neobacillus niacini]MCM3763420.1 ComF family protein [Neobacillus niacini]
MKLFRQERCYICHEAISPDIGWQALFSADKGHFLCSCCEGKLVRIEGETCRICCRPFRLLDEKFRDGNLCHDCFRWEEDSKWQGNLEKNISIFIYNDFLKEVIARYKFRGDYVLAKVFAEYVRLQIQKMNADIYVPIPLSEERIYERGFNQAEALLREAGFTPTSILTRIHSEKQSKKSRTERIHLPQVFQLCPETAVTHIQGASILLIDDIYTTGSTLRHAAKLLKEAGADRITSLTLAR